MCDDLTDPENGGVYVAGTGIGDLATYHCDNGYDMLGSPTVVCQRNGYWSRPPVCLGWYS